MKRRILLWVGSFLTLLLAFGVYQLFSGHENRAETRIQSGKSHQFTKPDKPGIAPTANRGGKTEFMDWDDKGRLRGVYNVADWNKQEDGSYNMRDVRVEIRHNDGQRTYIRGDRGIVYAEQVASGMNVRRGKLIGNVQIFFDRATDNVRTPMEERPKDVIKIFAEDLYFDNDLLTIQTANRVVVFSDEADIVGRGLRISWNESPRELRLLRMEEGQCMIVYKVPKDLGIKLPGGEDEEEKAPGESEKPETEDESPPAEAGEPDAVLTRQARPTPRLAALPNHAILLALTQMDKPRYIRASDRETWPGRASTPALWLAGLRQHKPMPMPQLAKKSKKKSKRDLKRSKKSAKSKPAKPKGRNIYLAEFIGSKELIHVDRGDSKVRGAKKLSLQFEWGREERKKLLRAPALTSPATKPAPRPTSVPAESKPIESQPVEVPIEVSYLWAAPPEAILFHPPLPEASGPNLLAQSEPADRESILSEPPEEVPELDESAAPDKSKEDKPEGKRSQDEPMVITWRGPLIIKPLGRTETPSRDHYIIRGEGPHVLLSDPKTTAICKEFSIEIPSQDGFLKGSAEQPAWLLLSGGEEIVCETIRLKGRAEKGNPGETDVKPGKIYLDGPGYILRHEDPKADELALRILAEPRKLPGVDQGDNGTQPGDAPADNISWQGSVEATLGEELVKDSDGKEKLSQTITEALLREKVRLDQVSTGDFIHCEQLRIWVARDTEDNMYPQRSVATGNVVARQQQADLRGDRLDIRFDEVEETAEDGKVRTRVTPTWVAIAGNVRVSEKRDDETLVATADKIESDLILRTAVLTGTPARIAQGPNELVGGVIHLSELAESAVVIGEGSLEFESKRDLNGRELKKPQKTRVTWTRQMNYYGKRNMSMFDGDVKLRSRDDRMSCETMRLMFEKAPPKDLAVSRPAADTQPAKKKRDGRMGIGIEQYSRRRVTMILAEKNVLLSAARLGENQLLHRRLQLTGDELRCYPIQKRIDMAGHGTLLMEDYRPLGEQAAAPAARDRTEPEVVNADMQRPSQTFFEWNDSMQLSQEKRLVVLEGHVSMVHRSGNQVVLTEKMHVPKWGKLEFGRKALLSCEKLLAKFGQPDEEKKNAGRPKTRPAAEDEDLTGPQLGSLELFTAIRHVNLKDGVRQVRQLLGQRLVYDRRNEIAIVWGYIQGQRPAAASLIYEDLDLGKTQNWSSERIRVFFKGDEIQRVETGKMRSSSAR